MVARGMQNGAGLIGQKGQETRNNKLQVVQQTNLSRKESAAKTKKLSRRIISELMRSRAPFTIEQIQ